MKVMKIVKYLLKTDWKTIMSDWKDYKSLRVICWKCKQKCMMEYGNIIVHIGILDKDPYSISGCVKRKLYMDSSQESEGNYRFVSVDYKCKSFSELQPCSCVSCKYNDANKDYIDAFSQYKNARSYKEKFWSKKIANVK